MMPPTATSPSARVLTRRATGTSTAERGDGGPVGDVERGVEQRGDHAGHLVEPGADGLAHEEARVDALEDHRELVEREDDVEVEIAQVAAGRRGVARNDLVEADEPGHAGGAPRRERAAVVVVAP